MQQQKIKIITSLDKHKNNHLSFKNKFFIPRIELRNISMAYNKKSQNALNSISFKILKGSFHVFVGENGAGKSTTIRIINGLNEDYDGSLLINGKDPKLVPNLRKNFCYIPDIVTFPSEFNITQYLYICACLVRNDKKALKNEINYYLNKFDIAKEAYKNPNNLSAGQKKKVMAIRILLERADVLILDEPVANLDPSARKLFLNILYKLNKQKHVTIFISTHILDEIEKYATHATFINCGKILYSGSTKNFNLSDFYNKITNNNNKGIINAI